MQITGAQTIAAPRQRVWDALNDPDILKASLPGCESVERVSAQEFKVLVVAAVGPLRAKFKGQLKMSDVQAPESCTMVFEGQGGTVGFGKGHSTVKLAESDGQTQLTYTTEAQVGGKLAQIGSRMIDSVARKMADDFFAAFKKQLVGDTLAADPPVPLGKMDTRVAPQAAAVDVKVPSSEAGHAQVPAGIAPAPAPAPAVALATGAASPVMVPGWWLGVASVIGCLATLAGALLAR